MPLSAASGKDGNFLADDGKPKDKGGNTMKKANYNISVFDTKENAKKLVSIPGYIFYFGGLRFGISNYYSFDGKAQKGTTWTITELTTGYSIGYMFSAEKQKDAIHNLTVEYVNRADSIRTAVSAYKGKDVNPGLIPNNEFLTVYPA